MVGTFPVYPWQRLFFPHNEVFIIYTLIHMVVSLSLDCTVHDVFFVVVSVASQKKRMNV